MADFFITQQPTAVWEANNPTLQANELGVCSDLRNNVETDTGIARLGNGVDAYPLINGQDSHIKDCHTNARRRDWVVVLYVKNMTTYALTTFDPQTDTPHTLCSVDHAIPNNLRLVPILQFCLLLTKNALNGFPLFQVEDG